MKKYLILAGILFAAMAAAGILAQGCTNSPAPPPLPKADPDSGLPLVRMQIGSASFVLEVTQTREDMERGLMFRQSLPADRGMLFPYDSERVLQFYMRNTYIPLDILYLDARGKIVSIHQMKRLDETTVNSAGPAQYAIELNQGTAARVGAKPGDVLKLPPLP